MSFFGVAQAKGLNVINIDKSLCHYLTAGGSRNYCFSATKHELNIQTCEPTGDTFFQTATEPSKSHSPLVPDVTVSSLLPLASKQRR